MAAGDVARNGHALVLAAGDHLRDTSIFSPAAPSAESIVNLSWLVLAVAALIFVVVEGVLLYSVARFRSRSAADGSREPPQVYGSDPIEIAWTVAPAVIVFFLVLVSARTLWEVNAAPVALADGRGTLEVTVVARQWWWEYRYRRYDGRELGFITANELHIPVGREGDPRATRLSLESADVCHSFWVPRLGGKMDVIPGIVNTLWLEPRESGEYLGQCAEYCGTQHAHMLLKVVAESPEDFERWLAIQARPAVEDPQVAAGREAFLSESCVNCHRIRGTPANGGYAPDLTHLMSRKTIAGCAFENDPQQLERWIHDPQALKPGSLMPAFGLNEQKEQQIVRYLLTLE
jgi:cytochrome c oxidase subunit 2